MPKTWPFLIAVAVVGAAAGAAVAGRPSTPDGFVLDPSAVPTTVNSAITTTVSETSDAGSTTTSAVTTTSSTSTTSTTTPDAVTTTTPDITTTTEASDTTTTEATSTTEAAGDTTRPREEVRIVLANGDGRFNLAGANAARLLDAGYVTIDQTDIFARYDLTTLYYREGFEDEAAIVAADLLVPDAVLEPLGDQPITADDDLGDVIVVLGGDALR